MAAAVLYKENIYERIFTTNLLHKNTLKIHAHKKGRNKPH